MSRRGNCHDKAVAGSFFSSMKLERSKKKIFASRNEARLDLVQYSRATTTIEFDTATTVACGRNSSKIIILERLTVSRELRPYQYELDVKLGMAIFSFAGMLEQLENEWTRSSADSTPGFFGVRL